MLQASNLELPVPQNTCQYLLTNTKAVIKRSKATAVHSKLDGDFVWSDSQIITGTGFAEKEISVSFVLTRISADLKIHHQTDAWEKNSSIFPLLDTKCFNCEENYVSDEFQLLVFLSSWFSSEHPLDQ